ncbi:MAG TPA: hypothetical protein VFO19_09815 [Vicinamibacterales bacterium]|nr:hypothetical protein [Vicinamibacterales bacterium]
MTVPPDQVSAQLERILASAGFRSADRASRFLRYVVERTIAGEGDQLKEYVIGCAVFDRGDDYDPRIDSIVRVEAGRLRSKLDEYYAGPGRTDGIIIRVHRGTYVPEFERAGTAAASTAVSASVERDGAFMRSRVTLGVAIVVAVLAVAALVAWRAGRLLTADESAAPTIAVLPFDNFSMQPAERMLAARATDGVTAELARLGTLGVVSHTSALQYADARPRVSLPEIARALNAQYVLEGKVRDDGGRITIQVVLVDGVLDRKIWVHDIGGTASDLLEMQREVARATSAAVLQRRK